MVAAAGLVAGAVNAVAGGGTLVTFPALLGVGLPAVVANITSSVGLITGYAGGSLAYRRELAGQRRRFLQLTPVSIAGGVAGAVVLLETPASAFRAVVPYLVLAACALLAAQPYLARRLATRETHAEARLGAPVQVGTAVSAVYGSYFGAGLGVLLLGVLGIFVDDDVQRLNALKGLLSLEVNVVGVIVFLAAARVSWGYAGILAVTAYLGGTIGVAVARRLPGPVLRTAVVVLGVVVAAGLFATG